MARLVWRKYRRSEKRLAKYRRVLSRKPKGSQKCEKARLKVVRVHERIVDWRRSLMDALSYRLVREYDVIVVDDLALKGMAGALGLGKK
ncbi:MAG: transposase [Treponema sp.]|nr:transposase [Treponema sp.]